MAALGATDSKPLFSVKRGTPVVLAIENKTAFLQPLHVHGHASACCTRSTMAGSPISSTPCRFPRAKLHIAFIADNPGRWLISSTVLERFDLGLWTWFEVT
jgi:FtsP/CotA-like multicopper oxidase with cupredoxin domain